MGGLGYYLFINRMHLIMKNDLFEIQKARNVIEGKVSYDYPCNERKKIDSFKPKLSDSLQALTACIKASKARAEGYIVRDVIWQQVKEANAADRKRKKEVEERLGHVMLDVSKVSGTAKLVRNDDSLDVMRPIFNLKIEKINIRDNMFGQEVVNKFFY